MCEILVGRMPVSATALYTSPQGCGLVLLPSLRAIHMVGDTEESAREQFDRFLQYFRDSGDAWFVNHARVPTVGRVARENTQPFVGARFVFAHNGHHLNLGSDDASDSRELWNIISRLSERQALALLRELGQRYVLYSVESKTLHLIGRWALRHGRYDRGFEFKYVRVDLTTNAISREPYWNFARVIVRK